MEIAQISQDMEDSGRVKSLMWRALCHCTENKVKDESTVIVGQSVEKQQTVLFVSCAVLARCLLGRLLTLLEDRQCAPKEMRMLSPTIGQVKTYLTQHKMYRLKDAAKEDTSGAVIVARLEGASVVSRTAAVVNEFLSRYALDRKDIIWSDSPSTLKKDLELWFPAEEAPKKADDEKKSEENGTTVRADTVKTEMADGAVEAPAPPAEGPLIVTDQPSDSKPKEEKEEEEQKKEEVEQQKQEEKEKEQDHPTTARAPAQLPPLNGEVPAPSASAPPAES